MLFFAYIYIAEYEAYWLMGFPIINHQGMHLSFLLKHHAYKIISTMILICFQKVNNQVKEKNVILQSIGIIHCINKSEETGVVAYTCRYSSGKLIPIFQSVAVAELGIKGPLEYLQV